ncbi:MAG: Crp/Fnr family transcriptional regulator [Deltaproteobacteria bacterium]|nr:MAG: Crp/Fnr family transcriptional regulator [Deltaproteobacteria bacterium]
MNRTLTPQSDLLARLCAFPNLDDLSAQSIEILTPELQAVELPAGEVLLNDGDECRALLLVEKGGIRVYRQNDGGRQMTLYRVEPGESCVLGTSCVIGERAYPALAETLTPTQALVLPAPVFRQLFASDPAVQRFVMELFSRRLADLMLLVSEVGFGRMDLRLARFLLQEAEKQPGQFHPVPLSHEEIALHLGTAREVVSRLLHQFADEGLIRLERRRISLVHPESLRDRSKIDGV